MQAQEHLQPDRIDSITANLRPYVNKAARAMADINPENGTTLCDYIFAELTERNIADSTREWRIKVLTWLSKYFQHKKSFKSLNKQDILQYLNTLRKPVSIDPDQRWVGTYNNRVLVLNKFFRWLYNPDEPDFRKRTTPPCMSGVKQLPKKNKTRYKPSDMWTAAEHDLFLRFCPQKRDKCYHAMARDTSARPHELLKLRIGDLHFKKEPSTGKQYAEVVVSGKTKTRTLPLIDSLLYIKEWMLVHPLSSNADTPLFISLSDRNKCKQLTPVALLEQYNYRYKGEFFPKLLLDPSVSLTDKETIKGMLSKPWNPYVQRHSALTEKAQFVTEATLRDHAGWSMNSDMPLVYIHFLASSSSKSLLEARGIISKDNHESNILQAIYCPNCQEPNTPHSKFCLKCKMVLTPEEYADVAAAYGQGGLKDQISELRKMLGELMVGKGRGGAIGNP
jgi:integrase